MGMVGMESSPDTLGAKLTVLKEGGGGSTGKLSMMVRFMATLLLLGTLELVEPEPELGGEQTALFSSLVREARVFLGEVSQSQGKLGIGALGQTLIKMVNYGTLSSGTQYETEIFLCCCSSNSSTQLNS